MREDFPALRAEPSKSKSKRRTFILKQHAPQCGCGGSAAIGPTKKKQKTEKRSPKAALQPAEEPKQRCIGKKAPPPDMPEEDVLDEVCRARVQDSHVSTHPRRKLENEAARHVRSTPTLPPFADALDNVNAGAMWPAVFCAFEDCLWMSEHGTETDIYEHILAEHAEEVAHATALVHSLNPIDAVRSVYNAAISHKVCQDAPGRLLN